MFPNPNPEPQEQYQALNDGQQQRTSLLCFMCKHALIGFIGGAVLGYLAAYFLATTPCRDFLSDDMTSSSYNDEEANEAAECANIAGGIAAGVLSTIGFFAGAIYGVKKYCAQEAPQQVVVNPAPRAQLVGV